MAAAQSVFALPELLEHILSFLPEADLLLKAPSTCRYWKGVIDVSPILQMKLFLTAEVGTEVPEYGFNSIFFFGYDQSNEPDFLRMGFRYDVSKLFFNCSLRTDWNESWERMHISQPSSTTAVTYLQFDYEYPDHSADECEEDCGCDDYCDEVKKSRYTVRTPCECPISRMCSQNSGI
ncbi:hypothetical protein LTR37_001461 [Vermiconidia calcicola]|uniref:Uncharacterized protein n=1 Tax=Vermiconidia calcicola TaxID=1690605 RepID=A0ACC3NW47_9PEZI|nr:hypothetical protein LTR37_001461 [Vermiconidia calcicola]